MLNDFGEMFGKKMELAFEPEVGLAEEAFVEHMPGWNPEAVDVNVAEEYESHGVSFNVMPSPG